MKKFVSKIYISLTSVFIGVCVGLLVAKASGKTTVILARQWDAKYDVVETYVPEDAGLININTATAEELCMLPGIGAGTADKIIAYLQQHSAFFIIEDLLNIDGFGQAKLDKIKDYITVRTGE